MEEPQKSVKQSSDLQSAPHNQKTMHSTGQNDMTTQPDLQKHGSSEPLLSENERGLRQKMAQHQTKLTTNYFTGGRVMAEGWCKLSDEERAKLEIDIFKPLDFYEILFNRIKENNSGKIITSLSELYSE